MSLDAFEWNERGRERSAAGDSPGAISAYRAAVEADPAWSVPWYNLGLEHKRLGEWSASAECNREALSRDASDGDAWWNLGIAATALGDWRQAREAWRSCGLAMPEGDGPLELDYGPVPIRLAPETRREVVWCDRIDPARAVIRNIPLPESGHRFGDVVLHDGAPNGTRTLQGRELPVFDALARLRPSDFRTFLLDLPDAGDAERALLGEVASELGGAAEDWSRSVAFLCRRCAEGGPHDRHDTGLEGERPRLAVAAAARDEAEVRRLLRVWRERSGFSGYVGLMPAVEP